MRLHPKVLEKVLLYDMKEVVYALTHVSPLQLVVMSVVLAQELVLVRLVQLRQLLVLLAVLVVLVIH
tara:strand:- start:344 stop:544 length:201 start_codon:yes stop_codon:yes gene_type:complete